MGRENNQGFELTNELGNLGMRRPLTHFEGRHNPDFPWGDQSQLLIHGFWCPMAEREEGIRNGASRPSLMLSRSYLRSPTFWSKSEKLTLFTNSDPKRKGTQSKRNKIVGKRVLVLQENDNCTDGAFIQTQNAHNLGFMNVPNLEGKTTGWGTLRRALEESKEVLLCFFVWSLPVKPQD